MEERLQKILARGGIASRRAAEVLVKEGRVRVNGQVVTELGTKADPRKDKVELDGRRVVAEDFVYAVLHKPRGVVSTLADPEGRETVQQFLSHLGVRAYPVGRLDFATSGVLLITNDGALADGLLHPKQSVPKTYVVKVNGKMTPADLQKWEKGIELEDGITKPAHTTFLRHEGDKTWFELTISEGRNQQIRRMGEASGFSVMRLARLSFAGINAEGLRPGDLRHLSADELKDLKKAFGVPKRVRPSGRQEPEQGRRASRVGAAPRASGKVSERGAREERPSRERSAPAAREEFRGPGRGRNAPPAGAREESRGPSRGRSGPPAGGREESRGPARGRGAPAGGREESRGPSRGRSGPPAGGREESRGPARGRGAPAGGREESRGPARGRGAPAGGREESRGPSRGPGRGRRS